METSRSIVLDYDVKINPLKVSDRILNYGSLGNYSLAGFEMILHRYVSHYIITYYLPSGMNGPALLQGSYSATICLAMENTVPQI